MSGGASDIGYSLSQECTTLYCHVYRHPTQRMVGMRLEVAHLGVDTPSCSILCALIFRL